MGYLPDDHFCVLHGLASDIAKLEASNWWSIVLLPEEYRCFRTALVYDMTNDRIAHRVYWREVKQLHGLWHELEGIEVEELGEVTQFKQDLQDQLSLESKGVSSAVNVVYGAEVRVYPEGLMDDPNCMERPEVITIGAESHSALRNHPEFIPSLRWMVERQEELQHVAPEPYKGRDLRPLLEKHLEQGYYTLKDISSLPLLSKT